MDKETISTIKESMERLQDSSKIRMQESKLKRFFIIGVVLIIFNALNRPNKLPEIILLISVFLIGYTFFSTLLNDLSDSKTSKRLTMLLNENFSRLRKVDGEVLVTVETDVLRRDPEVFVNGVYWEGLILERDGIDRFEVLEIEKGLQVLVCSKKFGEIMKKNFNFCIL